MTFFEIIYSLLIGPLNLLFEFVFVVSMKIFDMPGIAIIYLSIIMNLLVLPLYKRADDMQAQARDTDAKLRDGVSHIKKTFSGDEKMMVLQTYYRQNHYKPADALKGSVPLLLQIPFFIAAYQFLSHLEILNGASLGPIADLGRPDGMIVIGGVTINLLPIIMTIVNVISSCIYLKGFPAKTKIQLYGMALFFLVFLYGSPSGLVFYWTLNNVFSLIKTVMNKTKLKLSVLHVIAVVSGLLLFIFVAATYKAVSLGERIFLLAMTLLMELLIVVYVIIKAKKTVDPKHEPNKKEEKKEKEAVPNGPLFVAGLVFLTVLTGLLVPSNFIAASPQEYVDINYFYNPIWYVVSACAMAAGTFLVWMRVFYLLASPKGKVLFEKIIYILCGIMFVNYMFFGTKLGVISATLQYEKKMSFSVFEHLINGIVLIVVAVLMFFAAKKYQRAAASVAFICAAAIGVMSTMNVADINASVKKLSLETTSPNGILQFDKNGKNVIVIMLDRGMGAYIPYIMNEKPELLEQFAGFTYYPNTISFGGYTNLGAQALMGGYEYTPVEMNKRSEELLVDKHNEALKVMPVLFSEHGYEVTVCDPPYANYEWIPDLSIFEDYPSINRYITKGNFGGLEMKQQFVAHNNRNFFCFGLMKSMPLFMQPLLYDKGLYNCSDDIGDSSYTQTIDTMSESQGLFSVFMESYEVLCNLNGMTRVTDDAVNTFTILVNDTTHDPMLLLEPEYIPAQTVDNTEYDSENTWRFTVDGKTLSMVNSSQMIHYHSNMAALMKLGEWFDFLRENDVYDNTKIIIVSDHGRNLYHFDELVFNDDRGIPDDVELYYPLLLVKDFGSTEFSVSEEFMTNADVPVLATDDLIENPINPFTGKVITNSEKTAHEQYIIVSEEANTAFNNGNTFLPARWARVKDDLWNRANWEFYDKEIVLDEYAFPDTN
ncbi:MAG: membrane protein insertase YidC [Clostridium sp.]|nr:membrane protein insertase YidC [Clostridium sp.]MCM1398184.1 membrane protein insertase YidC [Clostridium sp.]MCM1460402.1 membrane protein insertase YidC [Bacteroides sp.]